MLLLMCYPGCSTCKRAQGWLDKNDIEYKYRNIKAENPGEKEIAGWWAKSGLPLKRFFNTSGQSYRALGLSQKLPGMAEKEQLALLATDGMLVKRPLLVGDGFVLAGFREAEWQAALAE